MKIVYIHGMNTTMPKDMLKKKWDEALFGKTCDLSVMVYWGKEKTLFRNLDVMETNWDVQEFEMTLTKELKANQARQNKTKGLLDIPLWISSRWMQDVKAYFYNDSERLRIRGIFEAQMKIDSDSEKTIVIAHSLGTVIAYDAFYFNKDFSVKLFITIGSPLGFESIQARLNKIHKTRGSEVPESLQKRWVNIANIKDLVAFDKGLENDFIPAGSIRDIILPSWDGDPHSSEKYLSSKELHNEVLPFIKKGITLYG
jgi:hypothetical protein